MIFPPMPEVKPPAFCFFDTVYDIMQSYVVCLSVLTRLFKLSVCAPHTHLDPRPRRLCK